MVMEEREMHVLRGTEKKLKSEGEMSFGKYKEIYAERMRGLEHEWEWQFL